MQPQLIAALTAALVLQPSHQQEPVRAVERVHADGTREVYELLADAGHGVEVRHGDYQRFHPGGELAARGRFEHGSAVGRWRLTWPNGEKQAAGSMRDGAPQGSWRFWYADPDQGKRGKLAEVDFKDGRRSGEQLFWRTDGEVDERRTGEVTHLSTRWAGGSPRLSAVLVGGRLDGRLSLDWPDGTPALRAELAGSRPVGRWRAFHPDGWEDPLVLRLDPTEGWGQSISDLFAGAVPVPPRSDGAVPLADEVAPLEAGRSDAQLARGLAALVSEHGGAPAQQARVAAALAEIMERSGTPADAAAEERLAAQIESAFGSVEGLGLTEALTVPEHRRAIGRLALLALVCGDDDLAWRVDARQRRGSLLPPAGAPSPEDEDSVTPAPPREPRIDEALASLGMDALVRRLEPARVRVEWELDEEVQVAVSAGLDWLARHQSDDGGWHGMEFELACADPERRCDGTGIDFHDAGLTALALLAFADAGVGARDPRYGATVRDGLIWLLERWDREGGTFAPLRATTFMYDQALACQALARHSEDLPSSLLTEALRSSAAFLVRSRNPYGAWRYASPPDNTSDTSVTFWCIEALDAADRALAGGVDRECFRGGRSWVDENTDPATWRVGYDSMGGLSSRLEGLHDRYPVEDGEAMTAAAIGIRARVAMALGEVPAAKSRPGEAILGGLDLIHQRPPEWTEDGSSCDLYYWLLGARVCQELSALSPERSEWWRDALLKALLPNQQGGGCAAGSWDPIGPWGGHAGRVYSTAVAVSALTAGVEGLGAGPDFDVEEFTRRR